MKHIFEEKYGLEKYVVLSDKKDKEEIERRAKWKQGIDEIYGFLTQEKIKKNQFEECIRKGGKNKRELDRVFGLLEGGKMSETDKRLLAISLYIMREMGDWKPVGSTMKAVWGGFYRLESALEKDGKPNCIDTAVLAKELAAMYGIVGRVVMVKDFDKDKKKDKHSLFESDSGALLDVWQMRGVGGFALNEEDYIKDREPPDWLHMCSGSRSTAVGKKPQEKQPYDRAAHKIRSTV